MSEDLIRYDILVQDAMRDVVRRIITEVAKTGLPGEHHFYVTFDINHPGVRVSSRLREQYPQDMTIVLQHQFWDLSTTEHAFEVGLSFNNVPERLLVPYRAVKAFADPSVNFGLKFELAMAEEAEVTEMGELSQDDAPKPLPLPTSQDTGSDAGADPDARPDEAEEGSEKEQRGEVVSLDAFRKK